MPAPPLPNTAVAELAKGVAGGLIQPGDADFDQARRVWNGMIDRRPALIVRCAGADDVKAAVKFARKHEQLVAVRGGGHSVAGHGTCDGGLVVDLSPMREVHVDPQKRRASIQAGATWRDLDRASQAHRLAVTGGIVSETGVAGLTLGGGNFGIVTELRFRLHPVGPIVLAGWVLHPQDKATEVLRFYRNYAAAAPEELTTIVILRRLPHLPKLPPFLRGMPIIGVAVCHAGVIEAGERMVQPLRAFGPPLVDGISLKPYVEHQTMFDAAQPPGRHNYWKTSYLRELSDAAIDAIVDSTRRMTSPLSLLALYQLGGAARLGEAAFCLNVAATWIDPAEREAHIAWARESWAAIAPHATAGAYVNFLGDEGQERTQAAYRQDYERLVALKNTYDPRNFFRLNQNIQPTVV